MSLTEYMPMSRQISIEHVTPRIDCGRFPAKRSINEVLEVQADIFRDGHAMIGAALQYRQLGKDAAAVPDWEEVPMLPIENDRWVAQFSPVRMGRYCYRIAAWNDRFGTWRRDMERRIAAGQVMQSDVLEGIELADDAAARMPAADRARVEEMVFAVREAPTPMEAGVAFLSSALVALVERYPDRSSFSMSQELELIVDPVAARFSSWYELFPRSQGDPGRHGTLQDVILQLPRVASMGFDVLYLPPIHPIGRTHRKGPNNALAAGPDDVGSPWAIGNEDGGHKAIEPSLGTFEDFDRLVAAAKRHGIHIAMDFAIQCSPDHPYVKAHPEWFFIAPDGTIKYAENPPKKYQDIYPINFYCDDQQELWEELKSIVDFWIDRGVTFFRVDNPHTKPIPFWEWLIGEIKQNHPDTVFLAEAFTRPKVMRALAKAGFTQSYTYFTWRTSRWELTEYLTELTQTEMKDYFRGNLWPNTPDILHEFLQYGGMPAFRLRLVLAATLSSVYGIYSGYELGISTAVHPGSEEYLNSDKYQINQYDWNQPHYLGHFIGRVNQIRRDNPALQLYDNLRFYANGGNDNLIVYGKATPNGENRLLIVVNLDPSNPQDAWVGVPYWDWGISPGEPYQVHDLLTNETFTWNGEYNYVRLDPGRQPAHIFLVSRHGATSDSRPEVREIDFS